MSHRPTILICAEHYLPGFRAGGPIRSLSALVEHLSDTFDFKVVTSDRDHGVDEPFDGIRYGEWEEVGSAGVRYLSRSERSLPSVMGLLRSVDYDLLYVNSLYSLTFSLPAALLHRFGSLGGAPLVVAPKGQLAPSAIRQKAWKKRPFLELIRRSGLYNGVFWKASNETEAERIREWFGGDADVSVAPDLTAPAPEVEGDASRGSAPGSLRAVFLSRIHPIKNLDFVLDRLRDVCGDVVLDIYGPVDDAEYWQACRDRIDGMPENIEVTYHGSVAPTEVVETLAAYDLFILPTRGENFGHVIFEAMVAGTPVLISDRTLWTDLAERRIGWSEPLEEPERFVERIEWCVEADAETLHGFGERARIYAEREAGVEEAVEQTRRLFERALASEQAY